MGCVAAEYTSARADVRIKLVSAPSLDELSFSSMLLRVFRIDASLDTFLLYVRG